MGRDILIACVGKPSAGKSSFLNSITDTTAKVGNFPFTTIEPNQGVAYVPVPCACARVQKQDQCRPRYGRCVNGVRYIPIKILDVAGLVPGASQGLGLGNQFLDDLRTADALIHVVDVSGTTDAGGKETIGYDPIGDIDWLTSEIHEWVYNNLKKRWGSIVRRHLATKSSLADTLQSQFSGYGSTVSLVHRCLDTFPHTKVPMDQWDDEMIRDLVTSFLKQRFPTVVALNKIDLPDSDKHIDRIFRKYESHSLVLTSALAENFLRKLKKQGFIRYEDGSDTFTTAEDELDGGSESADRLKPMDEKTKSRLEKVQDLVLFRYGTTGVTECLKRIVELLGLVPVFPVRNIHNFSSSTGARQGGVFRDCLLVRPGTTVRQLSALVHPDLDKYYQHAETVGSIRLGEDDLMTTENSIVMFKTSVEVRSGKPNA